MKDLPTRQLLETGDVDRLANVIANLLAEVVVLTERVAALEGSSEPDNVQERINALVDRVMAPLA